MSISNHSISRTDEAKNLAHRLSEQKSRLNQIYDLELERQQSTGPLLTLLEQIEQLINEYRKQTDGDEGIYSTYLDSSLEVDAEELLNSKPLDKLSNRSEDENINVHTDYDDHSYARTRQNLKPPAKKFTILELKRYKYEGCCPLTTRTYGLDSTKHGIRHFPCARLTAPINLYKHLIQYHQLTHSPTMQIVRLLADNNEEGDVDLFSSKSSSLVATQPTIYRAQCPLNQYGKFGITPEHKIRLCTQPNQPLGAPLNQPKDVCLYDHFVVYHQMKRSCAQRLAEAIVRNKTDQVFRPDEQLLNETFYVQCPLRTAQLICWKSPISTRHMGQHLTGIHKLDRVQRQQIMTSLRKSSSTKKSSFVV